MTKKDKHQIIHYNITSIPAERTCISADFGLSVLPVLVATSIKQATCIKQACVQFPKQANTLKCTCIKQAPVLSKQILIVP